MLAVGGLLFLTSAHRMAAGFVERVLWARWNRAARGVEGTPAEAFSEAS